MTSLVSTSRIGLTELRIRIYTERGQELAFLRVVSRQNPDPGCRGIVPSYADQNYKFPHVPPPCPCLKFNKPSFFRPRNYGRCRVTRGRESDEKVEQWPRSISESEGTWPDSVAVTQVTIRIRGHVTWQVNMRQKILAGPLWLSDEKEATVFFLFQ